MVFETMLRSDLKHPVKVNQLTGNMFSADNGGNKITVEILDNGEAATISGSVHGYVIRQDNKTVVIEGTLTDNKASIVLPASAYVIIGQISIVIKVGNTTVGACTAYVYRTTTDTIVDPGSVIPSISELLAKIADCEAATVAATAAATAAGHVNIAMSKTGKVITVTTTNNQNQSTTKTITEPTTTVTKSGNTVTVTSTDADGTTTATITEPTTTVTKSGNTVTVTSTDADGTTTVSFDISNVDDTAGIGDTTDTWSADKTEKEIVRLDGVKANAIEESIDTSASVQTFGDGADNVPMGMKVAVEPIQDLHGYDRPWVGGSGKNLCKLTVSGIKSANTTGTWNDNEYTINGIKYKIILDSDGNIEKITANETATADWVRLTGDSFDLPAGTYILSGCVGGASASYRTTLMSGSSTITSSYDGDSAEFTLSETTTVFVTMMIRTSGYVASNVEFKPMIRLASVSDATYAPWENICPISGWTGAKVTRTGKNLLNQDGTDTSNGFVSTKYLDANGVEQTPSGQWNIMEYVKVNPNTVYTVNGLYDASSVYFCEYDKDKRFKVSHQNQNGAVTFTTGADTMYMRFCRAMHMSPNNQYVLKEGTDGTYEAYNATAYTIHFNTDCYGGSLTVNKDGTGTLVVDRGFYTFTGDEYLSKRNNKGWSIGTLDSVIKPNISNSTKADIISTIFKAATPNEVWYGYDENIITISVSTDNDKIRFYSGSLVNSSASEAASYIAGTSIVYPLATPVTYTIPAPVIRSLFGTNNVWADTGNVQEIQYSADTKSYIDNLFATIIPAEGVGF